MPSSPSAYGRASREASITPALTANAEPGDEPADPLEQQRAEDDEQPAASATAIADGSLSASSLSPVAPRA